MTNTRAPPRASRSASRAATGGITAGVVVKVPTDMPSFVAPPNAAAAVPEVPQAATQPPAKKNKGGRPRGRKTGVPVPENWSPPSPREKRSSTAAAAYNGSSPSEQEDYFHKTGWHGAKQRKAQVAEKEVCTVPARSRPVTKDCLHLLRSSMCCLSKSLQLSASSSNTQCYHQRL